MKDTILHWEGNELYVGKIYAGSVTRMVPEKWREWDMYKNKYIPGAGAEYIARNREDRRAYYEQHDAEPWRALISSSEGGEVLGWYATEDLARAALEAGVRE